VSIVGELDGKTVLICGGTAGIGLAMAERFLAEGAAVVLNGRDPARGAKALARLGGPERASFAAGDCTDPASARDLVDEVLRRHGAPDVLVASGGAAETKPHLFEEMPERLFEEIVRTQFLNRVYAIRAALPAMKSKGGSIIIMGTDAGRHSTVGESIHGSMGSAKIMLTKTLAREFARWNIRVNGLALTITGGTEAFDIIMARNDWVTQLFSKAIARFPAKRPPSAEEVARVALFLASDASAQVTGQTISVNGGLSFGGW
jgi:3-oxoacyl-[acyl-carrier protein] reductase